MLNNTTKIKHFTIPIFVPHAACPYKCVFCNQNKISGQQNIPTVKEIESTINNHLATIPKDNAFIEIGFFGGSFTAIPINKQKLLLEVASKYIKNGSIKEIRVSTRPDFIDDNILQLLKDYGVRTVELGAQSMDDVVLANSGRGHNKEDVIKASLLIKNSNLNLGLQMMIGLPFDTLEKTKQTALSICQLKADCVRIYPTLVIKDTILETLYYDNKYNPLTLEEAVEWTKDVLLIFNKFDINVIRIGLHPSDGLLKGDSLVAGPFHQSFKEFVLTRIWHDQLNQIKIENNDKKFNIFVAKEQLNYAIGYNSVNKLELQKLFPFVAFKTDSSLSGYNYYVDNS